MVQPPSGANWATIAVFFGIFLNIVVTLATYAYYAGSANQRLTYLEAAAERQQKAIDNVTTEGRSRQERLVRLEALAEQVSNALSHIDTQLDTISGKVYGNFVYRGSPSPATPVVPTLPKPYPVVPSP